MENNIGILEKAANLITKYGFWKMLQTIILLALFLFVVCYIPHITKKTVEKTTIETLQSVDQKQQEKHLKNIEIRRQIQPQIETTLKSLLDATNGDRAFIVELHNGSNNINGVPFLHGSVTYDAAVDGLDIIDEEYQNISLSRFEMSTYLHTHFDFIGSVDELKKIDSKLAAKLTANDIKYIAVSTLHDGNKEWGWFGVLYNRKTDIPSEKELLNFMLITSQTITKEMNVLKNEN
jgi:hypothetical protein